MSQLLYGLESAQLTKQAQAKIDIFQLKGLRQVLNITTTFRQMEQGQDRTNDNDYVYKQAWLKSKSEKARER